MSISASVSNAQTPSPSPTTAPVAASATGYVPPTAKERWRQFGNDTFGVRAILIRASAAGFSTWTNTPAEWGGQWKGFGKRFASNMGKSVIRNTTVLALDSAFHLDSRYVLSPKRDAASKFKNAFTAPFVARNRYGKKVFGFPKVAGAMTASFVSVSAWYPERYGWRDSVRNGLTSMATSAAFNLIREFITKK